MHILRTARQFLGNDKNNEFPGKFMEISGREETTSFSRKSFSFRNGRLCICTVFLEQKKRDSSFLCKQHRKADVTKQRRLYSNVFSFRF